MRNLVIFGGPGSGKGTQSAKLIDRYGLHHISTGDVLRDHIKRETAHGKTAHEYISKGHLIPDKLMLEILADTLDDMPKDANGIIFDGFPRTIAQAEELDKLLKERGMNIDAVIGLEVPDEELTERLIQRGKDSGRSDDNPDTIRERLKVYHNTTSPLKDYYQKAGKYKAIHGVGSIDDIFDRITKSLD